MGSEFSAAPYPGLRPFRAEESDIFFGREEQTDALLKRLQRSRFLAVVGPSGCGKSSLVRAGMIAALETGFMVDAGSSWRIAEMRPGNHPLPRLAQALLGPDALGPLRSDAPQAAAFLEATLRRGPLGLVEALRETPLPGGTNLLVLADQFEEIFRFRDKGDSDEADAFVALLLAAAQQRELPIYVVITMRSDYLGDCALFRGLPEAINDSQYLTPRLTREQCRQAIVGPARVFGGNVDAPLVNRLLNDFGPDPDQLPLLQHCLMRMWDRATGRAAGTTPAAVTLALADYLELGGLSRALSDHADEVLAELAPAQRRIAEVMFRRLTERGVGRRDTRAPARLGDVAAVAEVDAAAVVEVVEAFRRPDRSLVTPPAGTALAPGTLLDIGHESLIRQWRLLGEWVENETRAATMYARLRQTAQLWQAGESALWRNPDLERALQWEQSERPTRAWALRYGAGDDFDLALRFLRASEDAWREEQREEERSRERRNREEIERQTRDEKEKRLEAEARAGRASRRIAAITTILTVVLAAGWFAAWFNLQAARENAARAEVERERFETAAQAARKAQQEAEVLLARLTNSDRVKRAFLTNDAAAITHYANEYVSAMPQPAPGAAAPERFGARRTALGWKMPDGRPVYRYELFPTPQALAGPLREATQISYFMNHPSFQQKLLTAGAGDAFTASYNGWGCLSVVYVLVEYADPDKPPEVTRYPMCDVMEG